MTIKHVEIGETCYIFAGKDCREGYPVPQLVADLAQDMMVAYYFGANTKYNVFQRWMKFLKQIGNSVEESDVEFNHIGPDLGSNFKLQGLKGKDGKGKGGSWQNIKTIIRSEITEAGITDIKKYIRKEN